MESDTPFLRPRVVARLKATDRFDHLDATVGDFWAWAFSDLRSNVVRGVLAEFIVARALGADRPLRDSWDNFDVLAPDGTRIEVKSSGYLQSWSQRTPSRLGFGRITGRTFDPETNDYSSEREIRADVFVFAVHTCIEPAEYDCLNLAQWEFWVAAASAVASTGYRSLSMAWVRSNAVGPLSVSALAESVHAARDATP